MIDFPILRDLGVIIFAATAFVLLAQRLNAPTIVAYILAGLLLGPVTGFLEATDVIHLIAEVGIVLLLFLVGLELSLDKIRDVGRVAVLAGLGQVIFTAAGGFVLSLVLGFDTMESIFIATALTFSSTIVVVKVLTQKNELDSLYGRIAVGIFLVQDLVVIVALTLLNGLGQPDELSLGALARSLGGAFGGMLLLLGAALLSARYVLPPLFGWISASLEGLFIWSLAWCFLFVVAAELLQVSVEIGAFLAGLSLAQLPFHVSLRRSVHPLMNFFVMVFFVSLGVQMEVEEATRHWGAAIALSAFVLIGNPLIFMAIIARTGYGERTAFLTSITVAQISEFSFVFAAVGLSAGLIDESILSLIGVVGLVTIAASVYMILNNERLYEFFRGRGWLRLFGAEQEVEPVETDPELEGHVIVVGLNALGRRIVDALLERGEAVLVIDSDPGKLADLPTRTLLGSVDDPVVLEEARLPRAKLLVSALQIEDVNHMLAYWGREAGVPTSIHALDQELAAELREAGAVHVIRSKSSATKRLAMLLRRAGVIR
jgi:Kef-type K+ transport system membrane component KefB